MNWLRQPAVHVAGLLAVLLAAHLSTARHSEPFFNNDETKHTLTGVFVADALRDLPASAADPVAYAVRYYCQYPALGLVTWPPLFYAAEGLTMLALGPHFWVGRVCVAVFAAVAVVYAYRLARLTLSHPASLVVGLWTALAPTTFVYSQRVMLEVPTLAFVLAAVVHFEKYLSGSRGRDAMLACLLAAGAVLTRFDGAVLVVYFGLRLLATWNLRLLARRPVLLGIGLGAVLVVPYYAFTFKIYGAGLSTAVTEGTDAADSGFRLAHLGYYPASLPEFGGIGLTVAAAVGGLVALARPRRPFGPALALVASAYLLFTPLGERDPRHAIYWLPAVAVFAAYPVQWLWENGRRRVAIAATVVVSASAVWQLTNLKFHYVLGYSEAAAWVSDHRATDRPLMVDGEPAGSLVYHTRLHDPARRTWVLRGDKVIYNQFSDPNISYRQYAHTEAEVLALLEKWDPEYVVVEDPQPDFHRVAGAELLQRTLRANSGDGKPYELVHAVPVRSNYERYSEPGATLLIYRKRHRNPAATTDIRIELLGLGRSVGAAR